MAAPGCRFSHYWFQPDCFQATLFLSTPLVLCFLSFKTLPQGLCSVEGQGGTSSNVHFPPGLTWATATSCQNEKDNGEKGRPCEGRGNVGKNPPGPRQGGRGSLRQGERGDQTNQQAKPSADFPPCLCLVISLVIAPFLERGEEIWVHQFEIFSRSELNAVLIF